jgi:hypothetical protein
LTKRPRIIIAAAQALLAVAALVLPLPAGLVEEVYSTKTYPAMQRSVTAITNLLPIAVLDVAVATLLTVIVVWLVAQTRRDGFLRALRRGMVPAIVVSADVFLSFLVLWGLNYRRLPLEQKIEFDTARVTAEAMHTLGSTSARMLNTGYAAAHASDQRGPTLEEAFASAQRTLGSQMLATPGALKRSLLQVYFRQAAIDGMTVPWFLEVIINPDTLPFERPFVILHEWGHLAGYAHEAEANFVAWMACLQGNALAQYSGWMAIYEHVLATVPPHERKALLAQLEAGPRQDLNASAARYARSSPVVRTAARDVYDSYLRANRVEEGIASYTGVVRLILGAGVEDGRTPRLRARAVE